MKQPNPIRISSKGYPWRQIGGLAMCAAVAIGLTACGGGDSDTDDGVQGGGTYGQVTLVGSESKGKNFIPCTVAVGETAGQVETLQYSCGTGPSGPVKLLFIQEDKDGSSRVYYDDIVKGDAPDRKYKRYAVNTIGKPDDKVQLDRVNRRVHLTGVSVTMWIHDGYGNIPPETIRIDGTLNY